MLAGGSNVVLRRRDGRPDGGSAGQRGHPRRRRRRCGPRPARCGTTSSSPRSSTASAVSNACRASPARRARLPCRTSVPTGRRSPTRSDVSGCWTAPPARTAGSAATSSDSVIGQAFSRHSDAAIALEVEFALDADGRSAPLRYGELTAALGAEPGARADPAAVRDAVLALRRRKGMVLDDADHDTWSVGSFFTNPVVTPADFDRIQGALDGARAELPGAGRGQAGRGLAGRARGFAKGYPADDAPARLSTKHALALTNRGNATAADVIALARRVRDGVKRRIRDRTHTRADSGWRLSLGIFGTRDPRQSVAADFSAPGPDRTGGRGGRSGRARRMFRQVEGTVGGRRGAVRAVADLHPGQRRRRRGADLAGPRRCPRRLVPARRADQCRRQGRRGRDQPRAHRLHRHRAARLRRRLHAGRARWSVATARPSRCRATSPPSTRRLRSTASSSSPTVRSSASRCR